MSCSLPYDNINQDERTKELQDNMKLQQLLSYVRRAVDDYDMIQEGDRIAVGISGG